MLQALVLFDETSQRLDVANTLFRQVFRHLHQIGLCFARTSHLLGDCGFQVVQNNFVFDCFFLV